MALVKKRNLIFILLCELFNIVIYTATSETSTSPDISFGSNVSRSCANFKISSLFYAILLFVESKKSIGVSLSKFRGAKNEKSSRFPFVMNFITEPLAPDVILSKLYLTT